MEEVKYIPGDLVKIDGKLKVVRKPKFPDFRVRDIKTSFITLCCVKDIEPIPLTPAILKDNGWLEIVDRYDVGYQHPKDWRLQVQVIDSDEKYAVYMHDEFVLKLSYVHQLQHLLFGLGLDSNLKV